MSLLSKKVFYDSCIKHLVLLNMHLSVVQWSAHREVHTTGRHLPCVHSSCFVFERKVVHGASCCQTLITAAWVNATLCAALFPCSLFFLAIFTLLVLERGCILSPAKFTISEHPFSLGCTHALDTLTAVPCLQVCRDDNRQQPVAPLRDDRIYLRPNPIVFWYPRRDRRKNCKRVW